MERAARQRPAPRFHERARGSLLQSTGMGRLENIIARNRRPNQLRERVVVTLGFGAIVLLILALMVFTDLGLPPDARRPDSAPASAPASPAARGRRGKHVDGVLLRTPPAANPAQ